jgi:hypothetical protein
VRIHSGTTTSAVIVLLLAACTSQLSPTPPPPAPSPTEPPSTVPAASPTAESTTPPTERELSDRFWGSVIDYDRRPSDFHTLEDVVAGSDLIVSGRIDGSTRVQCAAEPSPLPGEASICGGGTTSLLTVAVDRVLKADSRFLAATVTVVLPFSAPDAELPRGELVLFLRNYGQVYVDAGVPQPSDSLRWRWYFLTSHYQGAVRNLDGLVDVPDAPEGWWEQAGPFPNDFDGKPFEQLTARIVEIVGS